MILAKIFRIFNDCFWSNKMNSHDTWVHYCWWKFMIKILVNVFYLFFSDGVYILSTNKSSYSKSSILCFLCASIRWFSSWVLFVWLMWSYGSSKFTSFTLGWWQSIVALRVAVLDILVFFKSFGCNLFVWLLWRSCYLDDFFIIKNGSMNGKSF